jgi:hypothetical protein
MNSKLIYLDTNIWNRLIDQGVSAARLTEDLASKGADLALSGQTVYELSRTFLSLDPNVLLRARDLFRYLKQFVDGDIPCCHDNMQQLHGEVSAMNTGASEVIAFYSPKEYALLRNEVEKLSQGICDTHAEQFITGRKQFSESTRSGQKNHFQSKQHVKNQLKAIPQDDLRSWLDKEMLTDSGTAILASHLLRMYIGLPEETAILNAAALLRIPPSRVAKGIVRADLYLNWRCANRDSIPKDLADDLYHVLNSSYCAIYATAEPRQAKYASLVLSEHTRVAIYTERIPVDAWVRGLVQ